MINSFPQSFQYQGSKRACPCGVARVDEFPGVAGITPRGEAALILRYLPENMPRLVEPFCGSAAVSIAAAARGMQFKI